MPWACATVNCDHNPKWSVMRRNSTAIARYRRMGIGTRHSYENHQRTSHHLRPNGATFDHHAISNSFCSMHTPGGRIFCALRMWLWVLPFSAASLESCRYTVPLQCSSRTLPSHFQHRLSVRDSWISPCSPWAHECMTPKQPAPT